MDYNQLLLDVSAAALFIGVPAAGIVYAVREAKSSLNRKKELHDWLNDWNEVPTANSLDEIVSSKGKIIVKGTPLCIHNSTFSLKVEENNETLFCDSNVCYSQFDELAMEHIMKASLDKQPVIVGGVFVGNSLRDGTFMAYHLSYRA